MKHEILASLERIVREENVRILFACESGSRAWGFSSLDSDYDVRFVYVRPLERYLGLDEPRDVIERPITGDLDVNGWDLRKFLRQFRKSNPVTTEWLDSPIVYHESTGTAARIRQIVPDLFAPTTAWHLYMSMAKSAYRVSHKNDEIALKKYFYILRPLFAVMWIEQGFGPVPMQFSKMTERIELPDSLRHEIGTLLKRKAASGELGRGPRIEPISGFVEQELEKRAMATPISRVAIAIRPPSTGSSPPRLRKRGKIRRTAFDDGGRAARSMSGSRRAFVHVDPAERAEAPDADRR